MCQNGLWEGKRANVTELKEGRREINEKKEGVTEVVGKRQARNRQFAQEGKRFSRSVPIR